MHETQETVGGWNVETFGAADPGGIQHVKRVLMEVVEMCKAAGMNRLEIVEAARRAYGPDPWPRPDPAKVPEEAGDVQITLWGLGHRRGFSVQGEADAKMIRNRRRLWRLNGDGTAQHVPDAAGPESLD